MNLLRKPSCGARLCLRRRGRLANRRPLRHPRLAASATGGASAAMPDTLCVPRFRPLPLRKRPALRMQCWSFWQGQKDLVSPAASVSSRQSATGARSPLGTRFWSGCGRAHQGAGEGRCHPILAASPQKAGAGLVLRGNFAVAVAVKLPQIQSGSPPGSAGCPQRTAVSFPPGPRPASQKTPGWRR